MVFVSLNDNDGLVAIFGCNDQLDASDVEQIENIAICLVRTDSNNIQGIPRMINPKQKMIYGRLLNRMNGFAMKHNGRIKGVVDYKNWSAHIYVEMIERLRGHRERNRVWM